MHILQIFRLRCIKKSKFKKEKLIWLTENSSGFQELLPVFKRSSCSGQEAKWSRQIPLQNLPCWLLKKIPYGFFLFACQRYPLVCLVYTCSFEPRKSYFPLNCAVNGGSVAFFPLHVQLSTSHLWEKKKSELFRGFVFSRESVSGFGKFRTTSVLSFD